MGYYYRTETWSDVGWRFLVLMMVMGIIAGGIFTHHGQWFGIVMLMFGIISAFVYAENITRGKDYRKYDQHDISN